MKLVVLVPSRGYKEQAGARIRYGRITDALADEGVTLSLTEIEAFDPNRVACDVVLISKCYDARALVAAAVLRRRKILVGLDIFDDYFSQSSDSRLTRFRSWLQNMLRLSDFALCSTPGLAATVAAFDPEMPVHVLNDPAPRFDHEHLAERLRAKAAQARSERLIRIAWFGVGDNPHFPVGVSDLLAFSPELLALAGEGMAIELSILTNWRALDADGLARISALPVPAKVEEWTERREAELLERAFASFLPVSAQPFSASKSLNRAITALASGCQILSAGYPLYRALDAFLYRRPEKMLADLERDRLRLSVASLPAFEATVGQLASPLREGSALAAFLRSRAGRDRSGSAEGGRLYLVHGAATSTEAHELVRASGGLSVGTPFCPAALDYDVIVEAIEPGKAVLLVANRVIPGKGLLRLGRPGIARKIGRRTYKQMGGETPPGASQPQRLSLPLLLPLYTELLEQAGALLKELFGPGEVLISENSKLPFGSAD